MTINQLLQLHSNERKRLSKLWSILYTVSSILYESYSMMNVAFISIQILFFRRFKSRFTLNFTLYKVKLASRFNHALFVDLNRGWILILNSKLRCSIFKNQIHFFKSTFSHQNREYYQWNWLNLNPGHTLSTKKW